MELETLIRVNEAARILTASPRTLQRWKREGMLPYVKIGKLVRFRLSDIRRIQKEGLVRIRPVNGIRSN